MNTHNSGKSRFEIQDQIPGIVIGCLLSLIGYFLYESYLDSSEDVSISIDGSSTVYPITSQVISEFSDSIEEAPSVTLGISGTGGGFERFCNNEISINNASRRINADEKRQCDNERVRYHEILIGYDALTVAVNSENDWIETITYKELETIWGPDAEQEVTAWKDIREDFPPDRELALYGPDLDSGTFDYFTDEVVGKEGESRKDYNFSEFDWENALAIINNENALGYFGFSYYAAFEPNLRALAVQKDEADPARPSAQSVRDGSYPLSRPLFIYVNLNHVKKYPILQDFMNLYLDDAKEFVEDANYVPLDDTEYMKSKESFNSEVAD